MDLGLRSLTSKGKATPPNAQSQLLAAGKRPGTGFIVVVENEEELSNNIALFKTIAHIQNFSFPIITMPSKLSPRSTAPLVLDLQNGLMKMMGDQAEPYLSKIASTITEARNHSVTIAHCRVAFTQSEIDQIPHTNGAFSRVKADSARASQHLVDASGSQFHDSVTPKAGDVVMRKRRTGPFLNAPQDTDKLLRGKGIDTLVLAGVATSGAVLSTVVEAADLDYRLVVLEDGCWDTDRAMHDALMKFMAKRADIIKTDELASMFGE